jgi:hypothetical protein
LLPNRLTYLCLNLKFIECALTNSMSRIEGM